jgi:hypothetical protein
MEVNEIQTDGTDKPQDTPLDVRNMSYEDLHKSLDEPPVAEEPEKEPEKKETVEPEPVEEIKEATPEETKEPEPQKENPYEAMVKELEMAKQRIADKDRFIQRQGNEIGELRKYVSPDEVSRIKQKVKEEYDRIHLEEGPFAADEYKKAVETQLAQRIQEQQEAATINQVLENRQRIVKDVPDFETTIDDMVESLKEEGIPDNAINAFKQNPYLINYGELRQIHRTATFRKEKLALQKENETLKQEIVELKKRPDQLIENINKATTSINGKNAGTSAPVSKDIGNKIPRRMSYEELKNNLRSTY